MQDLFDYADEQVEFKRSRGKKGWMAAFRDATIFKTAYAFGMRRTETQMLDASDFGRNPEASEFADFGAVQGALRFELESLRDGLTSYQKHSIWVYRTLTLTVADPEPAASVDSVSLS